MRPLTLSATPALAEHVRVCVRVGMYINSLSPTGAEDIYRYAISLLLRLCDVHMHM